MKKNSDLSLRDVELLRKNDDLIAREKNFLKRHTILQEKEKEMADREDTSLLTSQKVEGQTRKLSELMDAYERKFATLDEKEKLLNIRDIKLSDREGVVASYRKP